MSNPVVDADDKAALRCQTLLAELAPRLEADRTLELELDRYLARRFSVFEYLRTDELGLSRVIADLLDPANEHGQGTTFLKIMLDGFSQTREHATRLLSTPSNRIIVRREHFTTAGGRIDITVEIPDGDKSFCLAFENKPYARESADQVTEYLNYLNEQYGQRFLLVYLPSSGKGPSDKDLSQADRALWENRFVVMPYAGENSLADWFASCRRRCEAERVRAFLRDGELFCKKVFGVATMTEHRETKTVLSYLKANPKYLRTALAVHDAWFHLRDEVCKRFLEHLRDAVEDRMRQENYQMDVPVRCSYGGDKLFSNHLWINCDGWIRYGVHTEIGLQSHSKGPNGWIWGVRHFKHPKDMSESERALRDRLDKALKDQGLRLARDGVFWLQYEYVKRYQDWYPHIPDLNAECESGGGTITTYFADNLLNIARLAVPVINGEYGSVPDEESLND